MKKQLLLLLVTFVFLFACSNDDDQGGFINVIAGCGVSNAAQDLDWLREEINRREDSTAEEMKYCYIISADLNGETIFIYEDCNPLVDKAFPILNCEGTIINPIEATEPFPYADIANRQLLWTPSNFECSFNL